MRNIKFIIIGLAILLCNIDLIGQRDPHYTLNAQPIYYSPSLTGVFNGSFRFNSNYRSQWRSALGGDQYETMAASVDFQLPVGGGDLFGIGFSAWNDQSSINNFRQRQFNISGAFAKNLGGRRGASYRHYLSGGGQIGLGELRVSGSSFLFSTQFDGVWIDRNLPNQEGLDIGDLNTQFAKVDAGLSYYIVDKKDGNYFLISAGLYHFNKPNISFFQIDGEEANMPTRFSISESLRYNLNKNFAIIQYGTFNFQSPFRQVVFGGQLRYQQHKNAKALRIGATARVGSYLGDMEIDAISPTVGLELQNLQILAAFDINISGFREVTNYRGGMEFSVIYTNPRTRKNGVICPQF